MFNVFMFNSGKCSKYIASFESIYNLKRFFSSNTGNYVITKSKEVEEEFVHFHFLAQVNKNNIGYTLNLLFSSFIINKECPLFPQAINTPIKNIADKRILGPNTLVTSKSYVCATYREFLYKLFLIKRGVIIGTVFVEATSIHSSITIKKHFKSKADFEDYKLKNPTHTITFEDN